MTRRRRARLPRTLPEAFGHATRAQLEDIVARDTTPVGVEFGALRELRRRRERRQRAAKAMGGWGPLLGR